MPRLIGPDFIGIQTKDLDAARTFYQDIVGLTPAAKAPPGAVVFETQPIPFAVRTPIEDLDDKDRLGVGIAIWFGCDDADELHAHLSERDVPIAFPPKDGPFGRYFAFVDPFGYTITAHTVPTS
ncbi:putative enzyme related to lactoylglutathione lyase [Rhizobium sp. BK650]|uniref:VOC family protein n=1 Tax=Rhizobium sp. BK650 TaxID=2586990 RepID=UPI00161CEE49|nr:VOC family protein [Rhizobium sp. BK650]MBB3656740.1 putative enzyme related to lactoylglutathione lyase [Rhizobium sp. BK650]